MVAKRDTRQQMELTEKYYTILKWYTERIDRFPRQARVLIGQPLQHRLFFTLDLLVEAVYSPYREKVLQKANIAIDRLRYMTRLCVDQNLLTLKQMEYIAGEINIVGGMLGNWLKTIQKKRGSF